MRISIPGEDEHGGPNPHPNYGDQIQNQGLMGQDRDATYLGERVPPEANLYLDWQEAPATFADGETVMLRRPRLRVEKLNFGPLGPEVMYSLRIAQPTFGLGLLEAVSEADILAIAERQKSQGVNGRPNYVWDAIGKRIALGRFGWKSNQPSIKQQIAAAALGDLGVTSPIFDKENCPPVQVDCAYQPPGNHPELIEVNWDELEFWTQALAVPARRNVGDADFRQWRAPFRRGEVRGLPCAGDEGRGATGTAADPGPGVSPLHRSAAARHGRGACRWTSGLQGRAARLAHPATVGTRLVPHRKRKYGHAARRPRAQSHRSHPLARRRSAERTRGISKHAEGGSGGAAEVPLLDLKRLLG